MSKILLTGVTGFVGRALVNDMLRLELTVVAAVRSLSADLPGDVRQHVVGDFLLNTEWLSALNDIDVVIHTAARVHIMNDQVTDPLSEFRKVNVAGTLNLARQAAEAGVTRFIFISSIKVNGEMTNEGFPFRPDDNINVTDPYGLSKYEAEQGLLALAKNTSMEVVIIRPPLIYGPGVKANFLTMMGWVKKGVPLPFAAIHNKKSFIAIDNLVSFIIHCVDHPKAANEVFLISDGEDISTTELLQKVAKAFSKKAMLFPLPVRLMTFVAKLVGKEDVANRLFASLQVDSSKARDLLGWKPVITMDAELKKTTEAFLREKDI